MLEENKQSYDESQRRGKKGKDMNLWNAYFCVMSKYQSILCFPLF